jgi:dihydrolipoamide dehydrogenase
MIVYEPDPQVKSFDLIVIGTGSAMDIVDALLQRNPNMSIAVIDRDEPGGICLTRGCIPSKILLYPAELVRTIEKAKELGIEVDIKTKHFGDIMGRMRSLTSKEIDDIRKGLTHTSNIVYYPTTAEFTAPYTMKAGSDVITGRTILLCTGSKPLIPSVKGLEETGYLTSDTILNVSDLPESTAIIGGGYIAAEYGHFLASMGSKVTILGRNSQFLPHEEPEVSALARRELQKHMRILTNHEVREAETVKADQKRLIAVNRANGETVEVTVSEIMVAAGRASNADVLKPEFGGIKTDKDGWIVVDDYLQTSQRNVWALGDADGRYQFKHKANYEALVVFSNAFLNKRMKVDLHAVPHAVFTYPEIASVGLGEREALERHGRDKVLIGIHRYEDTAKGEAMAVKDYFVKAIVEKGTNRILGAHIIGPQASILIQEVVDLMNTPEQSAAPLIYGMHIHPALSEVVQKAFSSLMLPEQYHHLLLDHYHLLAE